MNNKSPHRTEIPKAALPGPRSLLSAVLRRAIRERRILSITCSGALEPELFAPVALYVGAGNRPMVDGYEVDGGRVSWREFELEAVRGIRQTPHTYMPQEIR
jgi:hypothetical protein